MGSRDRRILEKVVSEIDFLADLLDGVDIEAFLADNTIERASAMTAINIGELAKHLSAEFFAAHPKTDLKYAAKTRDVYAHGYFSLSFETVYKTSLEDYPHLREEVMGYLGEDPSLD